MVNAAAVASAAAAVTLAVGVVVLLILQRRQQRQVRMLMDRLDDLEARLVGGSAGEVPGAGLESPGDETLPSDSGSSPPSGDVLAGLTSHVQRIVQGAVGARSLADQAILCIHRRLGENLTPAQMAADLYVSLRTLERGLAATLDCSPRQLILAVKMREAKRLLASGRRVGEVAEHLAFANAFHFSRRFKSFYRVAPSELRQRRGSN